MSRADRVCKTLPTWMLRTILGLRSMRSWWTAASFELFQREVVETAAAEANDESGPWLVAPPPGMH